MAPRHLTLTAEDGFPLAATLREAQTPATTVATRRRGVVLAGGTGVSRHLYGRLARHLTRAGFDTLTLDYRGIGGSAPRHASELDVHMADWGELDLPAAIGFMRETVGVARLGMMGHSTGGQIFGLLPERAAVDALFLVAAQTGHPRHWSGRERLRLLGVWYGVIPMVTAARGYIPGHLMGEGGEDLPPEVARQWARWGRRRDYIRSHAPRVRRRFAEFEGEVILLSLDDDEFFAPRAAVDEFGRWFERATLKRVHLEEDENEPDELEEGGLGHFGFFGGRGKAHWPMVVDFFDRVL